MTPVCVAVDVGQPEAVAEVEHDEDGEHHTGDRPGAAEDADPAEQHDGDHLELEAVARSPRTVPNRAAKRIPATPATSDEAANRRARPARRRPRVPGDLGVVADHKEPRPNAVRCRMTPATKMPTRKTIPRRGTDRAGVLAEAVEPAGEAADGAVLDEHARRTRASRSARPA